MIDLNNIDMSFDKGMLGIELSRERWEIIHNALLTYAKSDVHAINLNSFDDVAELYLDVHGVLKLYDQQLDRYKKIEGLKRAGYRTTK